MLLNAGVFAHHDFSFICLEFVITCRVSPLIVVLWSFIAFIQKKLALSANKSRIEIISSQEFGRTFNRRILGASLNKAQEEVDHLL